MKFFTNFFSFKRIYSLRELPLNKAFGHFLILVLLISFPLNFNYVKNGIDSFNNITMGIRTYTPEWFPYQLGTKLADSYISKDGLSMPTKATYIFNATLADETPFEIVFTNENYAPKACSLVFTEDAISYYDAEMNVLTSTYGRVKNPISMRSFFDLEPVAAAELFYDLVDNAFGAYFVSYFVITNVLINLLMNTILVLLISAIFLFVRINYKKVTTFKENINITVAAMTIPAIFGALVGMTGIMELNSFSVVIFQFATPLIALGAIYKGGKEKEILTKGL